MEQEYRKLNNIVIEWVVGEIFWMYYMDSMTPTDLN
jgi:hypothetical protein